MIYESMAHFPKELLWEEGNSVVKVSGLLRLRPNYHTTAFWTGLPLIILHVELVALWTLHLDLSHVYGPPLGILAQHRLVSHAPKVADALACNALVILLALKLVYWIVLSSFLEDNYRGPKDLIDAELR